MLQQDLIVQWVQDLRCTHKKMGGRKLYHLLGADIHRIDPSMGRDKFFDLLGNRQLLVRRVRKYAHTTQSKHWFRTYENKLCGFIPVRPHQVWVCDITYVRLKKGFVYLFLLTDAYSRKIVGWHLSESLGLEGALQAQAMALRQCPDPTGLIHHSDRGFQYCAYEYVRRLQKAKAQISMGSTGNCYENAMAERINGILKGEYGIDETFADKKQALKAAAEAIKLYNEERPHQSLNYQIPAQVHNTK